MIQNQRQQKHKAGLVFNTQGISWTMIPKEHILPISGFRKMTGNSIEALVVH